MYNESSKKRTLKYMSGKQKRVSLNWLKEDYDNRIKPAIDKSGLPVSTFIKEAVEEKILNEGLLDR